jgi:hypothetical protein
MRYILKRKIEPNVGDRKVVKKFLWMPKCLNGEIRWLELCEIVYEYTKLTQCLLECGSVNHYKRWLPVGWAKYE